MLPKSLRKGLRIVWTVGVVLVTWYVARMHYHRVILNLKAKQQRDDRRLIRLLSNTKD